MKEQILAMYIDVNGMWTEFLWYNDYKSETVKGIILNKIQKIMLKFVSSQHAEELRGRWSPCLDECPSAKSEREGCYHNILQLVSALSCCYGK